MSAAVSRQGSVGATVAAFVRRDFLTALSYRLPFVIDTFSSAFQLALFFYLSRIVDRADISGGADLTVGYFPFVVVGLVMMRIIDTALRSFSDKLRNEQAMGTFEVLIATPTRLTTLVVGSAAYNLLYGVASGLVMLLVAFGIGLTVHVSPATAFVAFAGLVASLGFFMAVGMVVAAFIVVFKQGSAVLGMATQLLGLAGGAYFPITLFPEPLEVLARANPLTWSLEILRGALLADTLLWPQLALLAGTAVILLPVALTVLRAAIDRARAQGTLAQY